MSEVTGVAKVVSFVLEAMWVFQMIPSSHSRKSSMSFGIEMTLKRPMGRLPKCSILMRALILQCSLEVMAGALLDRPQLLVALHC
jgi:hypothetical protein